VCCWRRDGQGCESGLREPSARLVLHVSLATELYRSLVDIEMVYVQHMYNTV